MTRSIVEIHVPIESIILLDVRALVQMLFLFVFLLILLEETIFLNRKAAKHQAWKGDHRVK